MSNVIEAARQWIVSGAWTETAGHLVVALIVIGIAIALVKALRSSLHRLRGVFKNAAPFMYIVEQLGSYAIIIVGLVTAATVLGLDLTSLTLFGGAVGVGVGLGLQGVVKEFVSGIVLIFDKAVQVGDFVELESGVRGEIVEIGPRAVRMRTNDQLNVVIPNSSFMQDRVTNWTYNDESRRTHVPFSVAEESDIALVRDVVLRAARSLPLTAPEDDLHKCQVWLNGFSGAGLEFDLVVWPTLEASRHPRTLHAAYTWAVYEALQAAGIRNSTDQMEIEIARGKRDGERSPRALLRARRDKAPQPAAPEHTRNDAAADVHEEAERRQQRPPEPPRERVQPDGVEPA